MLIRQMRFAGPPSGKFTLFFVKTFCNNNKNFTFKDLKKRTTIKVKYLNLLCKIFNANIINGHLFPGDYQYDIIKYLKPNTKLVCAACVNFGGRTKDFIQLVYTTKAALSRGN